LTTGGKNVTNKQRRQMSRQQCVERGRGMGWGGGARAEWRRKGLERKRSSYKAKLLYSSSIVTWPSNKKGVWGPELLPAL